MDLRILLASLGILVGVIGYIPYFRNLFLGKSKPHAFSWLVWGILTATGFFAQLAGGAGAGAWVVGITSGVCFIIAGASYAKHGIDYATRLDWLCFWLALGGILIWRLTQNPLSAIVIVTITDLIAYVPTFRKGYFHPHEETASLFILETFKYLFGIAALEAFNPTTLLYPIVLVISNAVFVTMLLSRRRVMKV